MPTHEELVEELLAALPDWVTLISRLSDLVAERLGIHPTDMECLHFLNRHGPATAGELAGRVGRSTGAVTRMIDRLERAGFVRRVPSPTDRRSVHVTPVPEVLHRIDGYFEPLAERSRAALAGHRPAQLNVLLEFVRTSAANTGEELAALLAREADSADL